MKKRWYSDNPPAKVTGFEGLIRSYVTGEPYGNDEVYVSREFTKKDDHIVDYEKLVSNIATLQYVLKQAKKKDKIVYLDKKDFLIWPFGYPYHERFTASRLTYYALYGAIEKLQKVKADYERTRRGEILEDASVGFTPSIPNLSPSVPYSGLSPKDFDMKDAPPVGVLRGKGGHFDPVDYVIWSEHYFPNTFGYHMSFYAGKSFYVPDGFSIAEQFTNTVWARGKKKDYNYSSVVKNKILNRYMYIAWTGSYENFSLPYVGGAIGMWVKYLYPCLPHLSYVDSKKPAKWLNSYKKPFAWDIKRNGKIKDITDRGETLGTVFDWVQYFIDTNSRKELPRKIRSLL